jgi:hypothetical protein
VVLFFETGHVDPVDIHSEKQDELSLISFMIALTHHHKSDEFLRQRQKSMSAMLSSLKIFWLSRTVFKPSWLS